MSTLTRKLIISQPGLFIKLNNRSIRTPATVDISHLDPSYVIGTLKRYGCVDYQIISSEPQPIHIPVTPKNTEPRKSTNEDKLANVIYRLDQLIESLRHRQNITPKILQTMMDKIDNQTMVLTNVNKPLMPFEPIPDIQKRKTDEDVEEFIPQVTVQGTTIRQKRGRPKKIKTDDVNDIVNILSSLKEEKS